MAYKTSSIAPPVLWLLGPSAAGKTTLAAKIAAGLREKHNAASIFFDGDEVRNFYGDLIDFSSAGRLRVVSTLIELANKASLSGIVAIVAALTAHEESRRLIRQKIPNLLIGYVSCPINVCVTRDPKGLYGKSARGEIDTMIGHNAPYAEPSDFDISVDTSKLSADSCADKLIKFLYLRLPP